MIRRGLYRVIGDGENIISLCHIDNLMHGSLLAAKQEKSIGQIYLIADERPYSVNEIVESIAKVEGVPLSKTHIPVAAAHAMALIMMLLKKVFNIEPMLTRNLIKEATNNWGCDISLAKNDLNYRPPVELQKGLLDTVSWYMQNS
jgi:nucleoside-diphosphate-sugar epimerase